MNSRIQKIAEIRGGIAGSVEQLKQNMIALTTEVEMKYNMADEVLNKTKDDMKRWLPSDWFGMFKNNLLTEVDVDSKLMIVAGGARNWKDPKVREKMYSIFKLCAMDKVLEEEDGRSSQKSKQEIVVVEDYKKERPTMSGEMIYDKLLPLMKLSSGGNDCVPRVVTWMLALSRNNQSQSELESTRREIDADVVNLRRNGGDGYIIPKNGQGWLDSLRYASEIFEKGRFNNRDIQDLLKINLEGLEGGVQGESDVVPTKLEEIYKKSRLGGFTVCYSNQYNPRDNYKKSFKGTPVFAITTERRMVTTVVRSNPGGDFFTDSRYQNVGECPPVGGSWDLVGAHEVMVVEYSAKGCLIVDPQTGMLLKVNKNEFDSRVRSRSIVFNRGVVI